MFEFVIIEQEEAEIAQCKTGFDCLTILVRRTGWALLNVEFVKTEQEEAETAQCKNRFRSSNPGKQG